MRLDIKLHQGPVLVTVEYEIDPEDHIEFLTAMEEIGRERKRDGAYAWGIFEDITAEGRFIETFLIESWLELMHSYERVTNADRLMEDRVRCLLHRRAQDHPHDRAQAKANVPAAKTHQGDVGAFFSSRLQLNGIACRVCPVKARIQRRRAVRRKDGSPRARR